MGTVPTNFPPDAGGIPIGGVQTGNALGLTAALAQTVFFTAPAAGLYLVCAYLQVVQTNNAGTIKATITTPATPAIAQGVAPAAPGDVQLAIEQDILLPATATDGFMAAIPVWLGLGQQIKLATVVSGLTGTTYNVFVSALRLF